MRHAMSTGFAETWHFLVAAHVFAVCLSIAEPGRAVAQNTHRPSEAKGNTLPDVVAAVQGVTGEARVLTFERGPIKVSAGGHFQGIQSRFDAKTKRQVFFLSHDSATTAYLAVVEFPSDFRETGRLIHIHPFPSDGQSPPLRHAGGIQLLNEILVVGLEDNQRKTRSEIQFWDTTAVNQLEQLGHLTIRRRGAPKEMTAGGVGIVQRTDDQLLAVANWDSRAIDFYLTNGKPLRDAQCRFELSIRWQADAADRTTWHSDLPSGTYQAINLISDAQQHVFLVGFDTDAAAGDYVDLFAVDLEQPPTKVLRRLLRRPLKLQGQNSFRAAGGVWIENDRLGVLSTDHDIGLQTNINFMPGNRSIRKQP